MLTNYLKCPLFDWIKITTPIWVDLWQMLAPFQSLKWPEQKFSNLSEMSLMTAKFWLFYFLLAKWQISVEFQAVYPLSSKVKFKGQIFHPTSIQKYYTEKFEFLPETRDLSHVTAGLFVWWFVLWAAIHSVTDFSRALVLLYERETKGTRGNGKQ